MSSTMRSICCDEVYAVRTSSCWSGGRRACSSRSSIGMMPLSGVRISWLIVARNSPLAITADSAACLALRQFAVRVRGGAGSRAAAASTSSCALLRLRSIGRHLLRRAGAARTPPPISAISASQHQHAARRSATARRCRTASSASDSAAPAAAPSASQRTSASGSWRWSFGHQSTACWKSKSSSLAACCTRLPWMKSMPLIHSVAAACGSSTLWPITCRPGGARGRSSVAHLVAHAPAVGRCGVVARDRRM